MDGVKFSERIVISSDQTHVFDFTQNYENRLLWDSFLKRAELIEGASKAERGVKAFCIARNGFGMVTEYVSFNRPKATAIKMTRGPYMFKTFLGSWTFKGIENELTEVTFLYSFKLRFPFNLVTWLVRNNLKSNVRQRLRDLKTNIENRRTDL